MPGQTDRRAPEDVEAFKPRVQKYNNQVAEQPLPTEKSQKMDASDQIPTPSWRASAQNVPWIRNALEKLPSIDSWGELHRSEAWFSPFHFNGNAAFELPFCPRDYVYSPVVDVPTRPEAFGYYKRGVKKYRTMIRKGTPLPPITILWAPSLRAGLGAWAIQDGGHRSMAAAQENLLSQPAVFGFPRNLLPAG